MRFGFILYSAVALLAEGVDRNLLFHAKPHPVEKLVALLAEGVDRNLVIT